MNEFVIFGLFFSLFTGGPSDLLDYMPSDYYWKAKDVTPTLETLTAELKVEQAADPSKLIEQLGAADFATRDAAQKKLAAMGPAILPQLEKATKSTDAEVATRSTAIIEELKGTVKSTAVRRLVVIRTLGEMKKKEALPVLNDLLKSARLFEADYAAQAIATIEGKAYTRPGADPKARLADLNLLPDKLGVVGQASAIPVTGKQPSVDEMIETLSGIPGWGGRGVGEVSEEFRKGVLDVLEKVGNVRVTSATMGVSEDVGNRTGFAAFILRGQYDRQTVATVLLAESNRHHGNRPADTMSEVEGVQSLTMVYGPTFLFPSDECLALVAGPHDADGPAQTAKAIALAMKNNKGKIGDDAGMQKILKTVDTTKPLWVACRINDNYKQVELLAPFDSITLTAEAKGADVAFKMSAVGGDAQKAGAAALAFNAFVKMATDGLGKAEKPDMLKGLIDSVKSIQTASDGGNVTVTATLKDAVSNVMMLPVAAMAVERASRQQPQPAQAQPPQPAK